jgi:hypothetical protein
MLRNLPADKNTAARLKKPRPVAAPLTCCGEERADLSKADHPVKKKLVEKKISSNP